MSCPDCFKGSIHTHAAPQGKYQLLHGHNTYIAGNNPPTKPSTIIYLPDAFGVSLVNNRLLADRYANETGCTVLVPDIIPGGGAPVESLGWMDVVMGPKAGWDLRVWAKKVVAVAVLVWYFIPMLIWGRQKGAYPSVLRYARAVRSDLAEGGKLGVCGFCWGGYGSTLLCTETRGEGGEGGRLIDAQFCAHPSGLETPGMVVDAISNKVPYSCAVPEFDMLLTLKKVEETEAVLRREVGPPEKNDYEFVVHKGCGHGFAVRASPNSKVEFQGLEDAARQAVNWFNRFL